MKNNIKCFSKNQDSKTIKEKPRRYFKEKAGLVAILSKDGEKVVAPIYPVAIGLAKFG